MNIRFPNNNITSESFVVQWDAVIDIFPVNYIVRWYRGDDLIDEDSVDGQSYTVTELIANTFYFVIVTANNTCCGEGENATANVTTYMRPHSEFSPTPTITTPITTLAPISIPTTSAGSSSDD